MPLRAKPGIFRSLVWRTKASACTANWPLPASIRPLALRPLSPPMVPLTSAAPLTPVIGSRGMRLSITFTTPPMALPPYISAAGPRTTSIFSATSGSMGTAWS
ncbi:hypothetical protein D3C87_1503240 [compost metagenome]